MNPELCNKRDFAATLDPLGLAAEFAFVSEFILAPLDDARIALGAMPLAQLRELASYLGWRKGGNSSEIAGRMLSEKTVLDFARCRDLSALQAHKTTELDFALKTIGQSISFGNKKSRAHKLASFAAETLHNARVNAAEEIQKRALADAIRQRRPFNAELATEWGVRTAVERAGYVQNGANYEFACPVSQVFTVDGQQVSAETLDRFIEQSERDIENGKRGVSVWETRLLWYRPDGDWPDREFADRHFANVRDKALPEAKKRLREYEGRLFQLREIKLNGAGEPNPFVWQTELKLVA